MIIIGHPHLKPKSIHDSELVEEFASEYLYLECIDSINKVKTAGLRWHSPLLDDISAVKSWQKVHSGLVKMYRVEVLEKMPIMQHFLFGTILPFKGTGNSNTGNEGGHLHQRRGDCCGNPLPSIYSTAMSSDKQSDGCKHVSRGPTLPFD